MNNATIFTADCTTHLKIVAVALLASILVLGIGIAARPAGDTTTGIQTAGPPLKAGKPVVFTRTETLQIR